MIFSTVTSWDGLTMQITTMVVSIFLFQIVTVPSFLALNSGLQAIRTNQSWIKMFPHQDKYVIYNFIQYLVLTICPQIQKVTTTSCFVSVWRVEGETGLAAEDSKWGISGLHHSSLDSSPHHRRGAGGGRGSGATASTPSSSSSSSPRPLFSAYQHILRPLSGDRHL